MTNPNEMIMGGQGGAPINSMQVDLIKVLTTDGTGAPTEQHFKSWEVLQ